MTQRPETMPETDAVELLVRQHREIRHLFKEVESSSGDARVDAFVKLSRLLTVHETAEEEVVHALARRIIDNGDRVIDARLEEENGAKHLLQELERMGPQAPEFEPLFATLRKAVLAHAEHEEREEFTELRVRSGAELRGMAAAIKAAEAMAPTHPHPGVESATKNALVGPFAAIVDRVRDMVRNATSGPRR